MCEVKSTEIIKHLNEEKVEKCSDVAGKLFQEMIPRPQKNCLTSINYNACKFCKDGLEFVLSTKF